MLKVNICLPPRLTQHKRFVPLGHSPKFLLRKNFFYAGAVIRNAVPENLERTEKWRIKNKKL